MTTRLALLLALLVTACKLTTVPPLRQNAPMASPIKLAALENRLPVAGAECSDLLLRGTSVEYFVDSNGKEFKLGIIELSDDGHVADDEQRDTVFASLREVALGGKGKIDLEKSPGAIIITFVHGWHHRSKVCDNNLACFRRVLQAVSEGTHGRDNRRVFGVYVGWRGDTIEGKASFLSFYDRKATAHRIGGKAGREILVDLDREYRNLNDRIRGGNPKWKDGHPVTMVTAGHSFGGALVYSAVEAALVRELRKVDNDPGSDHVVGRRALECGGGKVRPIRPGIGDLVVLVNPAFEARRYEFFVEDEKTPGRYADGQLPVLLTVASEGDSAVKVAFPVGRSVYFSAFPWRYRGLPDIIGHGHYDPHTTHNLVVVDDAGKVIQPAPSKRPDVPKADQDTITRCKLNVNAGDLATCKCEYDVPSNLAAAERGEALELDSGNVRYASNENISLRARKSGRDPRSPFIVARVSPSIISQHSDIYTPRFITFLTSYIREFLEQAALVEPGSMDDPTSPCAAATTARF